MYEAIGTRFLQRLMVSTSIPPGCPQHIFKSVALSILGAMAAVPEIATQHDLLEMVDPVLTTFANGDSGYSLSTAFYLTVVPPRRRRIRA